MQAKTLQEPGELQLWTMAEPVKLQLLLLELWQQQLQLQLCLLWHLVAQPLLSVLPLWAGWS